jgi:hypothetical protein
MNLSVIRAGVLAWLVLAVLTGVTWWVGVSHADESRHPRADTIALLLLAFFKARLIILHFMELRHAPLGLRALGEAWVVVTCACVVLTYLATAA